MNRCPMCGGDEKDCFKLEAERDDAQEAQSLSGMRFEAELAKNAAQLASAERVIAAADKLRLRGGYRCSGGASYDAARAEHAELIGKKVK